MYLRYSLIHLILLTTSLLFLPEKVGGQSVKLPAEVKVQPGRLAAVTVEWEGDDIKWAVDDSLDVFREYDTDPKKVRLRLLGYTQGKYKVIAVACKAGKLSEFATCYVIVGEPVPPVPPIPPNPPIPPVPPDPPTPAPIEGKRVLFIYETSEADKLTDKQQQILYGQTVRSYLNSHTDTESDGRTHAWRIWDKDVDASAESKAWQDAMKRPRKAVPWLIVSNGKSGYEGTLPASVDETMVLLKKYLGE